MTGTNKPFSIWAACMVASLATAFAASGAVQARSDTLRCEIAAGTSDGMISIEGLAHAAAATTGTYGMTISGAGANISQGGDFDAQAGQTVTLGSAMLGGSGRSYDVKLEISAGGATAHCAERIGGWL